MHAAAGAAGCWLLLVAAAAAGCYCWLLYSSSQQQQQPAASSQQQKPAAASSQQQRSSSQHGCCMGTACCCFKTGMHAARHAAALAAAAACVRGCLRDRHHISVDTSAQTQARRIEFPYRNVREEWTRTKGRARGAAPRARPFVRVHSSLIFLYGHSILHAWTKCTCGVGRLNIPILMSDNHGPKIRY